MIVRLKYSGNKSFEDIEKLLIEEHDMYYGKPIGDTIAQVHDSSRIEKCGYEKIKYGFRWLRASGTYIEFDHARKDIYCAGRRHSIDEFLNWFFTKDEILNMKTLFMGSQTTERPVGDTLS